MKKPELLAPVGHREALKAAVFAGADGVYLGGKEFNARRNATNFSREEIGEIVNYCHLFQVKVYITINILIKEEEMADVLDYVHFLYHAGVDALIIQDLGLFYLLKKTFPDFPIHSSTQMFVHGLEGVKLLEDLGFERIVLARELTTPEIKEVVQNTEAEIKVFNHGAMCICYSGQCLMSSMIGGRSGNRGNCAQPCRKPYELRIGQQSVDKGYLISPRDLNTLDIVSDLIETGADSFKIEGRKKSTQYVYTVVSAYRKLIDHYFEGKPSALTQRERLDIEQVFNRKFTGGYFTGESLTQEELIVKDNPKKRGVLVGEVESTNKGRAVVKLVQDIAKGDGLFIQGKNTEFGENLGKIIDSKGHEILEAKAGQRVEIPLRKLPQEKDRIYKNADYGIELRTKKYLEAKYPRKLPLDVEVVLKRSSPLQVKMTYKDLSISCRGEKCSEKAIHKSLSPSRVEEQFGKLGDTPFALSSFKVELDPGVTLPIAEINKVRREATELMVAKITRVSRPKVEKKVIKGAMSERRPKYESQDKKIVVKTSRMDILPDLVQTKADEIIYGGDIPLDLSQYAEVVKICREHGKDVLLAFPTVTRRDYVLELNAHLNDLEKMAPDGFLVSNYELISSLKRTGLPLEADYKLNAFNPFALYQLQDIGFSFAYVALELNAQEIEGMIEESPMPLGIFVHGLMELMVSQYSVLGQGDKEGTLVDKLGYEFPVTTDYRNRSHIFNSRKLSLYDEMGKIKDMDGFRIDITNETGREAQLIVNAYADRLKGSNRMEESLKSLNPHYTKGHFRRGVE